METEILGLRMSVKSLPSKSDAVQLSIKGEVLRVTDLVLIENKRLRDALEKMLDLALSAGNMNWGERLQDIEEISKQALKESE